MHGNIHYWRDEGALEKKKSEKNQMHVHVAARSSGN
jgi:hypothetical protein